jgi:hypothetical protein
MRATLIHGAGDVRVEQVLDPAAQESTDAGAGAVLLGLWRRPVAVRVDAGH